MIDNDKEVSCMVRNGWWMVVTSEIRYQPSHEKQRKEKKSHHISDYILRMNDGDGLLTVRPSVVTIERDFKKAIRNRDLRSRIGS